MSHAAALPFLYQGFPFEAMGQGALGTALGSTVFQGNILIVVVLNGGNDGLNTIIPLNQMSELNAIRPHVVLPESKLINLNKSDLAMHPALSGLASLSNENRLKIVQSVGYTTPNYSHFRSLDIWYSGADAKKYVTSGWLGRYLENKHPNFPDAYPSGLYPHPLAIEVGWNSSLMFTGERSFTSFVSSNPESFYEIFNEFNNTYDNSKQGEKLKYLQLIAKQSNAYGKVLQEVYKKGKDFSSSFERNNLSDQFKTIARLISGGLNTRIYKVEINGFDTHGNQVDSGDRTKGMHANLLKELDQSIMAFMKAMDGIGASDRILGMCISEFGRTINSNATNGTDHGHVAPVIFFGNKVDPSVAGTNPIIPKKINNQQELDTQFQFRQLYGSVLNQWLGSTQSNTDKILFDKFPPVQIIKASEVDSDEDGVKDPLDLCADTPLGAIVDVNGCPIFSLDPENFKLNLMGSTCIGTANGSLSLSVQNTNHLYRLTLELPNGSKKEASILKGANAASFTSLGIGLYRLMIRVEGEKDYVQQFDFNIREPEPLKVNTNLNAAEKKLDVLVSGANTYEIKLNDEILKGPEGKWSLGLKTGLNTLEIKTDLPCQGNFKKEFFVSELVNVFPNPSQGPLNIGIPGKDQEILMVMSNLVGQTVWEERINIPMNRMIEKEFGHLPSGTYVILLQGETVRWTQKWLKL